VRAGDARLQAVRWPSLGRDDWFAKPRGAWPEPLVQDLLESETTPSNRSMTMTEIVKKDGGQAMTEWNPLRAIRDLMRWDPFREMAPALASLPALGSAWSPSFDVTENKDSFVFKADVPGVKSEDLAITTAGNRIQISGKRDAEHEEKTDTIYTYERQSGSFTRSFTLPDGADLEHATSELKAGVLSVVIPKTAAAQAKRIPISTGKGS
jgi:HSP20 family protein